MKKIILATFVALNALVFTNAQPSTIFSDNFESYTAGQSLIAPELYVSWEGLSASIIEGTGANGSTKFASLTGGAAAKTQYFRKTLNVVQGSAYTFKIFTKSKISKQHRIGYRLGTGTGVTSPLLSHTSWTESNITTTTIPEGISTIDIWVQYYGGASGGDGVDVDGIEVIKDLSTSVQNTENYQIQVLKTGENQLSINGCEVASCNVYNVQGKLVKRAYTNQFDLNNMEKGVYLIKVTDKAGNSFNQKLLL